MNENLNKVFDVNNWFKEKQSGDFVMFYNGQDEQKILFSKYLKKSYENNHGNEGKVEVKHINDDLSVIYSRRFIKP